MMVMAFSMRDLCLFPHPAGYAIIALRTGFALPGDRGQTSDRRMRDQRVENAQKLSVVIDPIDFARKKSQRQKISVVIFRVGQGADFNRKNAIHNGTTAFARAYYTCAPARARTHTHARTIIFSVVTVVINHSFFEFKEIANTESHNGIFLNRCDLAFINKNQRLASQRYEKGGI